jgi:hypothetical protein
MYDCEGNFQDLTPVDSSGFEPHMVDPKWTGSQFNVTTVADDAGVERIRDAVIEKESRRTDGGMPTVDYGMDMRQAVSEYDGARFMRDEGDASAKSEEDVEEVGYGDFGPIYDAFKGKPREAAAFLIKKANGEARGVFHRDDLGDIDLIWGSHERHQGLEHLIIDHIIDADDFNNVEEMMDVIDDVIKNGKKEKKRKSEDKVRYEKGGYIVSIRKQFRDEKGNVLYKKNWIVTAFESTRKEHEKRRTPEESDLKWKGIFGDKKERHQEGP